MECIDRREQSFLAKWASSKTYLDGYRTTSVVRYVYINGMYFKNNSGLLWIPSDSNDLSDF